MLTLIKNIELYSPAYHGKRDILIANDKIVDIDQNINLLNLPIDIYDFNGCMATPGIIDQHIHLAGAGGLGGYASMTSDVQTKDLFACGTTTAVGLLGTDGVTKSLRTLYCRAKAMEIEGLSTYIYSGYYGVDSVTITNNIESDMIFIDNVLGCKIAISDIRSSYPTAEELVRKARAVRVGGAIANKKGILHIHLGNLNTKMDVLFDLINQYQFPIAHLSPTHVARTKDLFEQAIEFAKLGGIIDITTGASKYTEPHLAVLYALEQGVSIDKLAFSSDGHAGLSVFDKNGQKIGNKPAPFDQNLVEVVKLIKTGEVNISDAFKIVTANPAKNLGLKNKGQLFKGADADICIFENDFSLHSVIAKGKIKLREKKLTAL